jgi:hypothetical protein
MTLEIELLAELRAALAEHDVRSDVRDEVAALAVNTGLPGVYLWVFVAFDGRYFSWDSANQQHPVTDVQGTARRIAVQVSGND